MAIVTFPSILPDARETESGHRGATWHNEALVAKIRADRLSIGMTDA